MPKLVSSKGTTRKASQEKTTNFIHGTVGRKITDISRRSKNLIFKLDDGGIILVHLKMTGQLVYKPDDSDENEKLVWGGHPIEESQNNLPNKHTYLIFKLENGILFYNDIRQFGYLLFYKNEDELLTEKHFVDLGLEPLSEGFTLDYLKLAFKSKKGQLKKVFLDQNVVVGLGNIYADEVAFAAGVKPERLVQSLSDIEVGKIYDSIKKIIKNAIELGGSSVANYVLADGNRGNYAREHRVYKRGGKPCLVCGTILTSIKSAGRTTVFCTVCQV
jgi:formamidopyrimidine-DNA glycosylase